MIYALALGTQPEELGLWEVGSSGFLSTTGTQGGTTGLLAAIAVSGTAQRPQEQQKKMLNVIGGTLNPYQRCGGTKVSRAEGHGGVPLCPKNNDHTLKTNR